MHATVDKSGRISLDLRMRELDGINTKVGWFSTNRYEDGTPVAYIATIQEFGDPSHNIPPRPFMRTTIADQQETWKKFVAQWSKQVVTGEITAQTAMDRLGALASGDVRKKIAEITDPPLSDLTLAIRAHLIEAGTPNGRLSGGREVGEIARQMRIQKKAGTFSIAGVSTKPLIFSRIMYNTLTWHTSKDQP